VRARFDQLNRQYMGLNAFNDPTLQRQLSLNPAQLGQLRQLSSQWRGQFQRLNQGANANISPDQWSQLTSQYWDQVNAILTPQQQQQWTQLIGDRYNFPPNAYFGQTPGTQVGAGPGGTTINSDGTTGTARVDLPGDGALHSGNQNAGTEDGTNVNGTNRSANSGTGTGTTTGTVNR
jgi:hypothetical protein